MAVYYDNKSKIFLLQTRNTSYAMGVNDKGGLYHLYWGETIGATDCAGLLWPFSWDSFDWDQAVDVVEYGFWGGLSYVEPCLKVEFNDGVRDLKVSYNGHTIVNENGVEKLVLSMKDAFYGLEVRLNYRIIEEYDLIERYAEIENTGADEITLENVKSAVWTLAGLKDCRLTHVAGRWAAESQLRRTGLTEGKKTLESRYGNTGHAANPWFAIDDGKADEETGRVWFGALAWSGNWKIIVEKTYGERIRVTGGINDFDFRWQLKGGEVFTTPVFIGGFSAGGFGGMSRNLHKYQYDYILPRDYAGKLRKVLYNSWEATTFNVREQEQMELARKAAAMGVELFVVDDGWFGERHSDNASLGDWQVNPVKFPNGLNPLIEEVNRLGMDFGIWVEPEMVNPDSNLYRQHPDWVYHFPNRERSEARNQLVLNLGKAEVKAFILDFMTELLGKNNVKFIKWDMNRPFSEPGWPEVPRAQQQEIWVRHVQSLYEIWEELRKRFPHVVFECCAGGGARIDLGILRFADQFWTSDNTDAFDRLKIQEGYSYVYCPKAMMCWVTDSPNYLNKRSVSLTYRFHSSMMGSLGIGGNLNHWTEEEKVLAAEMISLYKELRPIVQEGRQYRLLSPWEGEVTAVQYVNEEGSEAVVFVFLHSQQFGNNMPYIRLRGLDGDAMYAIDGREGCVSGKGLMNIGIRVPMKGDFESTLIRIRRKS